MSRSDDKRAAHRLKAEEVRAEFEAAVAAAELEDAIVALKSEHPRCSACGRRQGDASPELKKAKAELRALRHVLRLGRQDDDESVAELEAIRKLAKKEN